MFNDDNIKTIRTESIVPIPIRIRNLQFSNSNIWQKVNQELVDNILDYCHSHGINWIDTAQIYGESESLIGQSLATLITGKN